MIRFIVCVLAFFVGIGVLSVAAHPSSAALREGPPLGRFECSVYKTLRMDPIFGLEGQKSHLHQFVGNPHVRANSTGWTLAKEDPAYTTCMRDFETSSVWFPTLYDDSGRLEVEKFVWYFRGLGDQQNVITPPRGLELIGRDGKGSVMWGCGEEPARMENPPERCAAGTPLRMAVFFPNCLKNPLGDRRLEVRWDDGANTSYAEGGSLCPKGYLPLPEDRIAVDYRNADGLQGRLRVSTEDGKLAPAATAAHADIMHGEQLPQFANFIDICIRDRPDQGVPPKFCVLREDPKEF